jgi:drug/metabolite transporter (DMT)-like permease
MAGLGGILVIVWPKLQLDAAIPALVMLASTVCSGLVINIIRKASASETGLSIVFYFMLACTAVSAATLPFAWVALTGQQLGLLVLSGFLGGLGQIFNTFAYGRAQPSLLGPFDYAAMLWAILFGVALFAEWPDAWTWTGSGIVIAAGLVIALRERHLGLQKARVRSE